jgi:natural product precursor
MRKLGKIKLNQFRKDELDQRKMNALKGGCSCSHMCACAGVDGHENTGSHTGGTWVVSY